MGSASPRGRGERGGPEAEGELSVRGEWDGQEGRGGSETWQGQASAGQGSLEPTTLDTGRLCSLAHLEKGRLLQSLGGYPVALWAKCAQGTPRNTTHSEAMKQKNVGAFLLRRFPRTSERGPEDQPMAGSLPTAPPPAAGLAPKSQGDIWLVPHEVLRPSPNRGRFSWVQRLGRWRDGKVPV